MDVIELQITNALQGMPSDDGLDSPSSPPLSPTSTIRRKKAARVSTQTTISMDQSIDFSKKPMSVIGALNEGPVRRGLGSIIDGDQVSTADRIIRTEGIAQRVASIQAKVGCSQYANISSRLRSR